MKEKEFNFCKKPFALPWSVQLFIVRLLISQSNMQREASKMGKKGWNFLCVGTNNITHIFLTLIDDVGDHAVMFILFLLLHKKCRAAYDWGFPINHDCQYNKGLTHRLHSLHSFPWHVRWRSHAT